MNRTIFGKTREGNEVYKYTIENSRGMQAVVTDFGAAVVDLLVPDKEGAFRDVSLGYETVQDYENAGTYFGATVAPYANRIANSELTIEGVTYKLDANENENNLHSGSQTLSKKVWDVKECTGNKIVFSYDNPHLAQGFPGNTRCEVAYEVNEENQLCISYYGLSDKTTVLNMTNHTYFNLNGWDSGNVCEHQLMIKASGYTPVQSSESIPTGVVEPVEGTPFDFRVAKTIGKEIGASHEQLLFAKGYDHNYALDKECEGVEKVAEAYSAQSGIVMEVFTDCVGLQLYTGNFLDGQVGKKGHVHKQYEGFCLETQYFPNAANEPNFKTPLTKAGEVYKSETIYGFKVK